LIEPYAIYGSSDYYKNDWQTMRELVPMDFDSVDKIDNYDNVFGGLRKIDSIGIKDSLIIFHCKGNDYSSDEPEWLIFNSTKAIGICYKSEDNFRKNLKKLGYLNIKLYNPDSVYKEFAISHKMPPEWKEYEKKEHEKYWWIIKYWFH
jgi:hypothetical protein